MPPKMHKKVFVANESFVANVDGIDKAFHQNRSRVREGDEILERYPQYFDLDEGQTEDYS